MTPLIDCDVLLYEIGFSCERKEEGVLVPSSWEFAQDLFDKKINLIVDEVGGSESPLLFLTNTKRINKALNKRRERNDEEKKEFIDNFRFEVAKEQEYKSNRSTVKPFHFYNLLHYVLSSYNVHVDEQGLEADDAMCIKQYSRWKEGHIDTIICSRDKDVRQCPGLHYSWECGKQAAVGPIMVDELGTLEKKENGKIFGTGEKFFYYQLLVGDSVDTVGGLKGRGPMFAYNLLKDADTTRKCYELVAEKYVQQHGELWKEKMREQADLLYMIRELDEKGNRVKWKPPKIQ